MHSINHRELTYKAVAGLAGGAIGWLPVELASHGHNLTDAMSTGDIIAVVRHDGDFVGDDRRAHPRLG